MVAIRNCISKMLRSHDQSPMGLVVIGDRWCLAHCRLPLFDNLYFLSIASLFPQTPLYRMIEIKASAHALTSEVQYLCGFEGYLGGLSGGYVWNGHEFKSLLVSLTPININAPNCMISFGILFPSYLPKSGRIPYFLSISFCDKTSYACCLKQGKRIVPETERMLHLPMNQSCQPTHRTTRYEPPDDRCDRCHGRLEFRKGWHGDLAEPPSPDGYECTRCGHWQQELNDE